MSTVPNIGQLEAFLFRTDLELLRRAFRASCQTLVAERERAEADVRKLYGLGPSDPWPEDDEANADFGEEIGARQDSAEDALNEIVIAFTMTLFHFWERRCNRWLAVHYYDGAKVQAALNAVGLPTWDHRVVQLQLVANALKHGNGKSCTALFDAYPALFASDGTSPGPVADAEAIRVSAALWEEWASAIEAAGPTPSWYFTRHPEKRHLWIGGPRS